MRTHSCRRKNDSSWIWMLSVTGAVTMVLIAMAVSNGIRASRSGGTMAAVHPPTPEESLALLDKEKFNPPVLRSCIINPESKTNYFDFVLDAGNNQTVQDKEALKPETTELINYFFLGITLPSRDLWVNLNPVDLNSITSPRLVYTDIGKALLETDLRLKKDAALLTDPRLPSGKQYWETLNRKLQEKGLANCPIPANTRLWIVPDQAVMEEEGTKVTLLNATLKVRLESEYFTDQAGNDDTLVHSSTDAQDQLIQDIASEAMKEAIVPVIEYRVNHSKDYAKLRQIYHSLILAEHFKHKYCGRQSLYESYINTCSLDGLESKAPWSKEAIFASYIQSIQKGEYSFVNREYDSYRLAMVKKHYFSGGMYFAGLPGGFDRPVEIDVLSDAANTPVSATTDNDALLLLKQLEIEDLSEELAKTAAPEGTFSSGINDPETKFAKDVGGIDLRKIRFQVVFAKE